MQNTMQNSMHRHNHFSTDIKGLLRLAGPLMLVALSMNIMMFLDRFILARYSIDVMNAVATVGVTCSILQYGAVAIASIAEVMVGQFNGARRYRRVGEAVWQMIWFSLGLFVLSIPLAIWGGEFLIPSEQQAHGLAYYQIMMFWAPLGGVFAALAAFFIGLGKTALVTRTVIIASTLNFGLALLLVFGLEGWVPALAGKGAAIATIIAQGVQIAILFKHFLAQSNRMRYGTDRCRLQRSSLMASLKIGLPNSAGHMIEIAAWAFLYQVVANRGSDYLTVFTIGESLFILFAFINDGLYKAVVAIVANFLGERRVRDIPPLIGSAVKVYALILLAVCLPVVLFPEASLKLLLGEKDFALLDPSLQAQIYNTLIIVWIYAFIDSIVSTLAGVLTAAGDTKFFMAVNACNAWFFGVMPTCLLMQVALSPAIVWSIYLVYGSVNLGFLVFRYRQGRWRELAAIDHSPLPMPSLREASA